MKTVLSVLVFAMSVSACSGIALMRTINKTEDALSPEQIKAYQEVGHKVYGCFYLSGPAVTGSTTWLVIPVSAPAPDIRFGPTCALMVPTK